MKSRNKSHFYAKIMNQKEHFPLMGSLELTYRCNLDCIHCYCKGSENKDRELLTVDWKKILDELQKQGCLLITFTGGDPLERDDFLELYAYAKKKGFIISIFTNGQKLKKEIIDYLAKSPPYVLEVTLNGITQDTYEAITGVKDSFFRVVECIQNLIKRKVPLILKTNSLKQNKHEIAQIKKWVEELLGKPSENKYYFKYDPLIYPRLNGDKTPCNYRLSYEEMLEVRKEDPDIWEEFQKALNCSFPDLKRDKGFLYQCNAWLNQFFINPYGRLKFCQFSEKFSVDLKTASFKETFYGLFPKVLNEKFKTDSKCKGCFLRPICYYCPARAYLETGNEESPVDYYCKLAEATAEQISAFKEV